jgi:hypothetical protein
MAMNCDDDQAASKRVGNLAEAEVAEIELWQGARMVAALKPKCLHSGRSITHEVHDGRMISKPAR